jgi:hypothetical protein
MSVLVSTFSNSPMRSSSRSATGSQFRTADRESVSDAGFDRSWEYQHFGSVRLVTRT